MNTMPNTTAMSSGQAGADFKIVNAKPDNAIKAVTKAVADNAATGTEKQSVATAEQVTDALSVVNKAAVFEQRSLSFMLDETSGRSVIKVMDKATEQVIRQIPSEELLKVAQDIKRLQDEMGQSLGLLIDRRV